MLSRNLVARDAFTMRHVLTVTSQEIRGVIGVMLFTVIPASAASADDKKFFENYVVAHGACGSH